MAEKKDLLIEIGTEELPPQALGRLSETFQAHFVSHLEKSGLDFTKIERFASPRRLALRVSQLDTAQSEQTIVRKGPSLKAAFDPEGNPTKAALGFARSCGVEVSDLIKEDTDKGAWLSYRLIKPGIKSETLIPDLVTGALQSLPIPKRMRWGDLNSEFVRPVHWVVLLFGDEPITTNIMDVQSGNATRGHRFHHPEKIPLDNPSEYEAKLRDIGFVEADYAIRKERIRQQATDVVKDVGGTAIIDPGLLDEVTSLTEWPVAILGSFNEEFLEVPSEVLIETMQKNQKYFPVVDSDGSLLPKFVTISNIESLNPDQVRAGNERVIRPRFKDAAFFWEQDLKQSLEYFIPSLDKVVFQHQLGTLKDKCLRIGEIAKNIAGLLGLDSTLASRSAQLCKCDLLTNMVGEFASLQGTMGRYYAEASGEHECVSSAMEEQYLPRHAGDSLPSSPCGQVLALADRLDSLVGIFAIGQKPTGVKDPYALRRASLGVMRILIETPLDLDLRHLIEVSANALAGKVDASNVVEEVFQYMLERLNGYYGDKSVPTDVVEAVLSSGTSVPVDIDKRIGAVMEFKKLPESGSLAAVNKRIRNILRKNDDPLPEKIEISKLPEPSEQLLLNKINLLKEEIRPSLEQRNYEFALNRLATLKPVVDDFFDNVMVLCDDTTLRLNRLALLESISASFDDIADISKLK